MASKSSQTRALVSSWLWMWFSSNSMAFSVWPSDMKKSACCWMSTSSSAFTIRMLATWLDTKPVW